MVDMSPIELFHEARLTEAIDAQRAVVAARPNDVGERLLLSELLAFTGDRAEVRRQLDRLADAPPDVREYLAECRALLAADEARHRGDRPTFLANPPDHLLKRLHAAEFARSGREEEALDLIDHADETAGWVEGHLDGRSFEGWRDADDLLGPVLELFHGDRYVWLAVDQVRKVRLEHGDGLRDVLYRPATVWLNDGKRHEVFLPGLYAGTADHAEEGIRTGAGIDWVEVNGVMRGLGARTFLFGEEELTLGEFRQVEVRT
jgi:type VI secretion system protein ImpE